MCILYIILFEEKQFQLFACIKKMSYLCSGLVITKQRNCVNYTVKEIDIVRNTNGITFYKMLFDDKCLFDDFVEATNSVKADKEHFASMVAWLDCYSPHLLMPRTRINHIDDVGRSDVIEFKKDNLRIYAIAQKPNIFVILGGYKTDQKKDIKHIKNLIKNLPSQIIINTINKTIQL